MTAASFRQKQPHSNQGEIDCMLVPAAVAYPTICIIFCHLFHSDYYVAASARNLLHSYTTQGTTSLHQTQPYFSNHMSLDQNWVVSKVLVGGRID